MLANAIIEQASSRVAVECMIKNYAIIMCELQSPILLPDAKCQVTYDYAHKRIDTFLISTQHREDVPLEDVQHLTESVMRDTANAHGPKIFKYTGTKLFRAAQVSHSFSSSRSKRSTQPQTETR